MAIEFKETLRVEAPIDRVWEFVNDPRRVVTCMPGAALDEVEDERTFLGTVKVKIGAITTSYKGRVVFTEVDAQARALEAVAEGRETSGGTAKGTITIRLSSLAEGATEFVTEASVDLTGRVMQVGRGMIQGVSRQLFKQFAASAKELLEARGGEGEAVVAVAEPKPLRLLPLVFRTLWEAVVGFFSRLFGRSSD